MVNNQRLDTLLAILYVNETKEPVLLGEVYRKIYTPGDQGEYKKYKAALFDYGLAEESMRKTIHITSFGKSVFERGGWVAFLQQSAGVPLQQSDDEQNKLAADTQPVKTKPPRRGAWEIFVQDVQHLTFAELVRSWKKSRTPKRP